MPLPKDSRSKDSMLAFVTNGFRNWKKAIEKFKAHEESNLHKVGVAAILSAQKSSTVSSQLSGQVKKEMLDSRTALTKIFSSLRYLGCQGLAIRGKTDEASNLKQLLLERAEDVPELSRWLIRPEKYKWISPEISNEILLDFSLAVQRELVEQLKRSGYYGVMIDESADISAKEQVIANAQWATFIFVFLNIV